MSFFEPSVHVPGSTTFFPGGPSTLLPGRSDIPSEGSGGSELPPFPTFPSGRPSTMFPGGFPTQQPGGFSTQPPFGYPTTFSEQPGIGGTPVQQINDFPTFQPAGTSSQPGDGEQGLTGYTGGAPFTQQTSGPTQQPTGTPSFSEQSGAPTSQEPNGGYSYQPTGTPFAQPGVEGHGTTISSGVSGFPEQPSSVAPEITGYSTQQPVGPSSTGQSVGTQGPFEQPGQTTEAGITEGTPGAQTSQPTIPGQPAEDIPRQPPAEGEPSVPPIPEPTSGIQQPEGITTGYSSSSQPGDISEPVPAEGQPGGTISSETVVQREGSTAEPAIPTEQPSSSTESGLDQGTPEQPKSISEAPEEPKGTEGPPESPSIPTETEGSGFSGPGFTPSIPRGFTSSSTVAAETEMSPAVTSSPEKKTSKEDFQTTISPEANTIPQVGPQEPAGPDDDKHPPHIHAIDVQCGKEMMTINIEFNRKFNGVIYSKGYYNMPECRYVMENSGQVKYSFTVNLNMCGTEFVNAFETEGQSYLENVLVLQNEAGIQEQWDTVRAVRCLWEGNIKDTLSVAFSIGMLSQEIVTFSGDTAMAKLDVVLGKGPFGSPANGLVKIGENMTLVVSVTGDPGFDIQVRDCKAIDSTGVNMVPLSDENGCILKPKLFGAFQKTRDTGNTGASVIAFAHFTAFKFPDIMDLMIECNIELCKTNCEICQKENESLDPILRRKRREITNNTLGEGVMMGKHLRVVLPEELENISQKIVMAENVCVSLHSFVFSSVILISLLVFTSLTSCYLWLKKEKSLF